MHKVLLLISFSLIFGFSVKGQTTKRVVEDFKTDEISFFEEWWDNPAMRFAYPLKEFTDVSFSYENENNEAHQVQKGEAVNSFVFRANSFFKDTTQLYYGKATYFKGNVDGLNWNTVADVDLLQPYIVADTIGGKMYNEHYFFSGGYARRFSKINLGALASYRALNAYKKKDPRPNNTVSDLKLRLGISSKISDSYLVGLAGYFNDYSQDQDIRIFVDGSGAMLYYLRGLGVADERFSTVITDVSSPVHKYKKNVYGLSLSLYPKKDNGLLAEVSTSKNKLELRKRTGKFWINVSDLKSVRFEGSFGYKFDFKNISFLSKLYGEYFEQKGTEYIYRLNETLLSTIEKYQRTKTLAGFEIMGTYNMKKIEALTKLNISYSDDDKTYGTIPSATSNARNIRNVEAHLQENMLWNFEKSSLLTKVAFEYRHNLDKNLNTGTLTAKGAKENLLTPDFLFETNTLIGGQITLRYDYQIGEKYRVYGKGVFHYAKWQELGTRQHYQIAVGLAF